MVVHNMDSEQLLIALMESAQCGRVRLLDGIDDKEAALTQLISSAEKLTIVDVDRALIATEAVLDLALQAGSTSTQANAYRSRAQALAYVNRFDEAASALKESLKLASEAGDEIEAARTRMAMLHVLARQGRFEEAVETGKLALATFLKLGEALLAAKVQTNLGVVFRMQNDLPTALSYFNSARAALLSEPVSVAQIDSNRAVALLDLNRYAEAEAAFSSAMDTFNNADMSHAAAIAEGNLADLMSRQGRLEEGLFHFERVRRFFETSGATGDLARLEAEQAEAYERTGLLNEAAECYSSAIKQLQNHGLAWETARATSGLGNVLTALKRFDEAETILEDAASSLKKLDHDAGLAMVQLAQGDLAIANDNHDLASELYNDSLKRLEDRPVQAAIVKCRLTSLHLKTGKVNEASNLIDNAITIAQEHNVAPLLAELHHCKANVFMAENKMDKAINSLKKSVELIENIRGSLHTDSIRSAFFGRQTAPYEDLVKLLLDKDNCNAREEAFHIVERSKSRSLLDLIAGAAEGTGIVPTDNDDFSAMPLIDELVLKRRDLNALYSRVEDVSFSNGDMAEIKRCWYKIDKLEMELRKIETRIASTGGKGGLFVYPADLNEVKKVIDDDTAVIEYYFAGNELLAFVIRGDEISAHRNLSSILDLEDLIDQAQFQIQRAAAFPIDKIKSDAALLNEAQRTLNALYRTLIKPLEESISGVSRLCFVPHGSLHNVPFHALFDGEKHVIERYAVTWSPSASLLCELKARNNNNDNENLKALIVGVADELAPRIDKEVEDIGNLFFDSVLLNKADGTCKKFASNAEAADILHIACHGRFIPTSPLSSGIKLSDGWFTVRDILNLDLSRNQPCVVLSACETGQSEVSSGNDLFGLIQGFLAAGASSLVISMWPLNDEIACIQTPLMYHLWLQGPVQGYQGGLAEALRKAQIATIAEFQHPLLWAPFILIGGN